MSSHTSNPRSRSFRGIFAFLLVGYGISCGVGFAEEPSYEERAALGIQTLQTWYDLDTGLYKTTGWWNSANAITVLANYSRIAQTKEYDFVFSNTLSIAQKTSPGFINKYYDDEGWWALAWIDVYELTHDERYLNTAAFIFTDMTYGWDDTCSGGIWWSKDRKYKNAIANELFLSVAAQLASLTKAPQLRMEYLAWASREWRWFEHSGMINSNNLVNDGLTDTCKNNQRTAWTYNQGVILGGLVALHTVDGDPQLLSEAHKIAQATLSAFTNRRGILHDPCEPADRHETRYRIASQQLSIAGCVGEAAFSSKMPRRDMMSLGSIEVPACQYITSETQVEMLQTFLEKMGVETVDLVGNDSGGFVAQLFLAKYPERV